MDTGNGGAGNDVIIGDIDVLHQDNSVGNNTIATAMNIDDSTMWSTQSNPLIIDDTVLYTTVTGEGVGEYDRFAVTVGAGQTLTADIDFAFGLLGAASFDSGLKLFDASMGTLELSDNNYLDDGVGSDDARDSLLSWTNPGGSAVTVYLRVE